MAQGRLTRIGTAKEGMLPEWDADDLRKALSRYDRSPFMDLLAGFLMCAPSSAAITKLADAKPDVFVKAVSDLARISGYTDKREVEVNHRVKLETLSDSQLHDRAKALALELGMELPMLIDAVVEDVDGELAPMLAPEDSDSTNKDGAE